MVECVPNEKEVVKQPALEIIEELKEEQKGDDKKSPLRLPKTVNDPNKHNLFSPASPNSAKSNNLFNISDASDA